MRQDTTPQPNKLASRRARGRKTTRDTLNRNQSPNRPTTNLGTTGMTIRYLGLALFISSIFLLSCLSLSRYAPTAPPSEVPFRMLARNRLLLRVAAVGRLRMQVVLTLALGGMAIWTILAMAHGPDDKKWAYGTLGTVLGYWLKG